MRRSYNHLSRGKSAQEFFDEMTIPEPNSGCYLWLGTALGKKGYGAISWRGEMDTAHRWAYRQFKGAVPREKIICHKCDVRMCVNPDHLWLGTYQQNTDDMMKKGRHRTGDAPKGSAHYKAILTESDVLAIRAAKKGSYALAERYGITYANLKSIRNRRSWRHI